MTGTMKAVRVHEIRKPLVTDEVPIPEPSPDQILVKVEACGACHSDLHLMDGDWGTEMPLPYVPGHEVAGTVVKVGSRVTRLNEGDRVGVPWLHSACGTCEYCITGWETLCGAQKNSGWTADGGLAEYMLADPDYVALIPEGLGAVEAAPILCAGVATYKALKESEARPGQYVVISGIGGLGHVAVQYAKAMGLHVIAVDVQPDKLALARQLGADEAVDASDGQAVRTIRKQFGGAHAVLVTAASIAAFQQALGMLRPGGTCVPVGLPAGSMEIPLLNLVTRRLTVRGSIVGTRKDLQEALQFAGEGKVKCNIEKAPLDSANDVFNRLRSGNIVGRVVLEI